ncbi:MAG: hypothetical protein QOE31_3023, partial [Solirubrobacteraceae bacterium]|nr:hypothetical protein [Solirubrobacteraceae bacterium]
EQLEPPCAGFAVRAVYAAVAVALSPRTASMTAGVCQGVGVGAEAWR